MPPSYRIEAFGSTDVGRRRTWNEDMYGCFPELGLFLVADGMGGQSSGGDASNLVVKVMRELFEQTASTPGAELPFKGDGKKSYEENRLVAAVLLSNRRLLEFLANEPYRRGLGSTVAAASVVDGRAQIAHVGDSRVYLFRDRTLEPLTRDHTLINEYQLFKTDLTPEEIASIPKNVITRAIGMSDTLAVDSRSLALSSGDVLLITSDGVHRLVPEDHIIAILLEHPSVETAAQKLVDTANENGGDDNTTCVLVRVIEA